MIPRLLKVIPIVLVVGFWVWWPFGLQHWLSYATGSYNVSGVAHNYNFFSGSGSDLGYLSIFSVLLAGLSAWYHKHNCHTEGCWRIGKHQVAGGVYTVCRRCHNSITGHPHKKLSIEHISLKHHEHLERVGNVGC